MRNELVWEQELYSTIEFKQPRPYLITFEGEIGHFALNFAAKEEAEHFFRFATKMMESRQRRRQRNAPPRPTANPPSAPSTGAGNAGSGGGAGDSEVVLRNQSSKWLMILWHGCSYSPVEGTKWTLVRNCSVIIHFKAMEMIWYDLMWKCCGIIININYQVTSKPFLL